jgi:hypothetical protein
MESGVVTTGGALQKDAEALMERVNANATQAMPQAEVPAETPAETPAN